MLFDELILFIMVDIIIIIFVILSNQDWKIRSGDICLIPDENAWLSLLSQLARLIHQNQVVIVREFCWRLISLNKLWTIAFAFIPE